MKVLVLGNHRQTITVVRSLARAGHTIVLGTPRIPPFSRFSNCVDEIWQHSEESFEKDFQLELESYLRTESRLNPIVVFPVGETQLRLLANLPVTAQSLAAWAMPPPEIVRGCLDKTKANHIAAKAGLVIPATRHVTTKAALLETARDLGFPLVFKHKDSTRLIGGKKAIVCWRPDDLTEVIGTPELAEGLTILAQKRISGFRLNCHFSAYDGKLGAYFQQRVLRTTSHDDSGEGIESVSVEPNLMIRADVEAIAGAFHYTGVGCVQFIVEEGTGKPWFLELNPRLDASCALPYFCGLDFPMFAVQIATAGMAPKHLDRYPVGIRLSWFYGDLLGLLRSIRRFELGPIQILQWLRSLGRAFFTTRRHLTWDWRDPVPTLYLYLVRTPMTAFRGVASLFSRRVPPASQGSAPSLPDKRDPSDRR